LGRAEAGLVGAQYVGANHGARQEPYVVRGAAAAPWLFASTGLADGATFGRYGIEIDARTPASPPATQLLAEIPNLVTGRSAEMTYYETAGGAVAFDAGVLDFAASLDQPPGSRLVENLWTRRSRP
jgi:hypothetical protein